MLSHEGKKAVITGGTGTIGLAMAELLLARGADVILTGRDEGRMRDARTRLGSPAAHVVRFDATSMDDIDTLGALVQRVFGQLDAVFVNHGVFEPEQLLERVTEASYDRHFAINTKGAYFTVRRLAPLVRDGGAIILMTAAHDLGYPGTSVYSGSKEALRGFAKVFAAEFLPRRIRVNCVAPGYVESTTANPDLPEEYRAEFERRGAETTPLGRAGTAEEVAAAALFLAFDATFITGAELLVDGGISRCALDAPTPRSGPKGEGRAECPPGREPFSRDGPARRT